MKRPPYWPGEVWRYAIVGLVFLGCLSMYLTNSYLMIDASAWFFRLVEGYDRYFTNRRPSLYLEFLPYFVVRPFTRDTTVLHHAFGLIPTFIPVLFAGLAVWINKKDPRIPLSLLLVVILITGIYDAYLVTMESLDCLQALALVVAILASDKILQEKRFHVLLHVLLAFAVFVHNLATLSIAITMLIILPADDIVRRRKPNWQVYGYLLFWEVVSLVFYFFVSEPHFQVIVQNIPRKGVVGFAFAGQRISPDLLLYMSSLVAMAAYCALHLLRGRAIQRTQVTLLLGICAFDLWFYMTHVHYGPHEVRYLSWVITLPGIMVLYLKARRFGRDDAENDGLERWHAVAVAAVFCAIVSTISLRTGRNMRIVEDNLRDTGFACMDDSERVDTIGDKPRLTGHWTFPYYFLVRLEGQHPEQILLSFDAQDFERRQGCEDYLAGKAEWFADDHLTQREDPLYDFSEFQYALDKADGE